jgi:hypothetical protein
VPDSANPRVGVAERVTAALLRRYRGDIRAVGVHGSVAHHDDVDGSDVAMTVVTYRAGAGPLPSSRRVDGVVVGLDAISADGMLSLARTLTPSWPLLADRYLTALAMYDPDGWHDHLRDTHLAHLAEAKATEFATLARQAWCRATAARARAIRLAEWHDTGTALFTLGEARLAGALAVGLLTRTYFRTSAEAVHRTGFGDAGMTELGERLDEVAAQLAKRGCPVDGAAEDLG